MGGPEALDAAAQVEARRRQEEERRQRRDDWEAAIQEAHIAYVQQLNRERLSAQCDQYEQAGSIRAYCAQLDNLAAECRDLEQAGLVRQWAGWGRAEADRIDPTRAPGRLRYVVPADISESELQEFMPPGMSAWRPPD